MVHLFVMICNMQCGTQKLIQVKSVPIGSSYHTTFFSQPTLLVQVTNKQWKNFECKKENKEKHHNYNSTAQFQKQQLYSELYVEHSTEHVS